MRRIDLYEHNRIAYEKVETMLKEHGKAAVIHPTGTGKSFIAFALIEQHPNKQFIWLAPSEYIYNLQIEKLWIKQHIRFDNVHFYTYNYLMRHEEIIEDIHIDYIILDEFHRAGAKGWGKTVKKLLNTHSDSKVLGVTATNIRYLDSRRDMADEIFDGYVASEMSICEAMAREILPVPKYVIAVYSYEEKLQQYLKRIDIMQNGLCRDKSRELVKMLRRALDNADGLNVIFKRHLNNKSSRVIVFCSSMSHLYEMVANVPKWFYDIDINPHVYSVNSSNIESEDVFRRFKDDDSEHLKILFCIDMLNEGIHVDGVNAVVLCRPTISPIVYKQQIGRAIATGNNESPIIFDLVNNFESLSPIAELQDEYIKAKGEIVKNKYDYIINGFEVIDELSDCRVLMEQIQKNIETSWDVCFKEFVKYVEENGTTRIPRRYVTNDGFLLGKWLQRQRGKYKNGKLSKDRVAMLEEYGINWDSVSDERFNLNINRLTEYKNMHGDLNVPRSYITEDGSRLGEWCANTRIRYEEGELSQERIKILEEIGFSWEQPDYFWERGYKHLKEYFEGHGNIKVPTKYICDDGYKLGSWLNTQRKVRKGKVSGVLTKEKIDKLDELGMVWDITPVRKPKKQKQVRIKKEKNPKENKYIKNYESMLKEYKKYVTTNNDVLVPLSYVTDDGKKLGKWLAWQRNAYRNGELDKRRIRALEEIGMEWENYETVYAKLHWDSMYKEAEKYAKEHGSIRNITSQYITKDKKKLGYWIAQQRGIRKGTRKHSIILDEEKIAKLNSIGMNWKPPLYTHKSKD